MPPGGTLPATPNPVSSYLGRGIQGEFCLRTPAPIGRSHRPERELFVSDLFKAIRRHAAARGASFRIAEDMGSNLYHVACLYRGALFQLIHWPTVHNIDLRETNMGPYANFVGPTFGNFTLQGILRDGVKKGWFAGMRVTPPESPDLIPTAPTAS